MNDQWFKIMKAEGQRKLNIYFFFHKEENLPVKLSVTCTGICTVNDSISHLEMGVNNEMTHFSDCIELFRENLKELLKAFLKLLIVQ